MHHYCMRLSLWEVNDAARSVRSFDVESHRDHDVMMEPMFLTISAMETRSEKRRQKL
jgi:hypothetical protein